MTQPYSWTKEEAQIIKGIWATDAGQIALKLIVERLCGLHQLSFDDTNALKTAFNEGRRSVGYDLSRVINAPLPREEDDGTNRHAVATATERHATAVARRHTGGAKPDQR